MTTFQGSGQDNQDFSALVAAIKAFSDLPGQLLIASDFDGVLAPLQDDPTQSRPLPQSDQALRAINGARNGTIVLAYVSGRKLEELVTYASPPAGAYVFGTHGSQTGRINADGTLQATQLILAPEPAAHLARAAERAEELARTAPNAWVERKSTSVVLHTRLASNEDSKRVETQFRVFLAGLPLHTIPGHDVTEVSASEVTKGIVVSQLRNEISATAVLYLGDDVTDETVFSTLSGPDIGIKVGAGPTAAGYRVSSPQDVAFILATIADMVSADL